MIQEKLKAYNLNTATYMRNLDMRSGKHYYDFVIVVADDKDGEESNGNREA